MSHADEFSKWKEILDNSADDDEGDCPIGDLAWKAMNAIVDRVEDESQPEERGTTIGYGISCAAFWLAAGAVIVAIIWRFA